MIKKSFQFLKRTLTRPKGLNLNSVFPVSEFFGEDRGTAIDRYYIEKFLYENRQSVKGRLLEIAEDRYMTVLGSDILSKDVLHPVNGSHGATIIGDLTSHSSLPDAQFDNFICTQTIHVIYKFSEAIKGGYKLLKPGGTMLATLAGITQISRFDMDRWGDYWRFTPLSAKLAFEEVFGEGNVEITSYGNCFAAVNLLRGIALEEIESSNLDIEDPNYPVIIGVSATRKA